MTETAGVPTDDKTAELMAKATSVGSLVANCVSFGFGGLHVDGYLMDVGATLVKIWAVCSSGFVITETTTQGTMLNVTIPLFRIKRTTLTYTPAEVTMMVEIDADNTFMRTVDDTSTIVTPARYTMAMQTRSPGVDDLLAFHTLLRSYLCSD